MSPLVTLLALILVPCLVVNWVAFILFAALAKAHRNIRALTDRRWLSLGIAVLNTTFVILALTYYWRLSLGAEVSSLLFVLPVYALTLVNVVALWLTWRRKW